LAILDAEIAAAPSGASPMPASGTSKFLAIEEAIAVQTRSFAGQKSDASNRAQLELSQPVLAGLIESPSL